MGGKVDGRPYEESLVESIGVRFDGVPAGEEPHPFILALIQSPSSALRTVGRRLAYAAKSAVMTAGADTAAR